MNVLIVCAHHDDLELGCGGTVARLIEQGHRVASLVLTHSGYRDPKGRVVRSKNDALREGRAAAKVLGYTLRTHKADTLDIQIADANARPILEAVAEHKTDTIFTHWAGDTHPAHRRVFAMALHAGRRVPRMFGFAANAYLGAEPFNPTTFVALEERHWRAKVRALEAYAGEFRRTGRRWVDYYDRQTRNFGMQIGVERAEGFVTLKNLWDLPAA